MASARFRILRHRPDAPAVGGQVSWRLLATNNRDLGRSPVAYPDPAACRSAVTWLQRHADGLEVQLVRTGPSTWSWRLLVGPQVAAVSSRDYQRRIQADQAARIARSLIPVAELVEPF